MSKTNDLTKAIILYLNYNGFRAWRNNSVGIYDPTKGIYRKNKGQLNGIGDVIGFRKSDGKHIEVEVKTGSDKLSPDQLIHINELKTGHCIQLVANTFDQFESEIKQYKK